MDIDPEIESVGGALSAHSITRIKLWLADPNQTACPVSGCPAVLSSHQYLLNHLVATHASTARETVPFACYDRCNRAFGSQKTLLVHQQAYHGNKRGPEEKSELGENSDPPSKRAKITCCGYEFSGRRKWNYDRHLMTRHGQGDLLYRCLWPECKLAYGRSDTLRAHIEREHQQGDEKKLHPLLVARQDDIFIFLVRKSVRGAGGHCHVRIIAPPDEDSVGYCEDEHCILVKRVFESSVLSLKRRNEIQDSKGEAKGSSISTPALDAAIAALRTGTDCVHVRSCLLQLSASLNFNPKSCDYDLWRTSIFAHSGADGLFNMDRAKILLSVIAACEKFELAPVVPGRHMRSIVR